MKDLEEVVEKVKGVEDGVTNLIVPILKDAVKDSNKHNTRIFIICVILAISILVISLFSQHLVMKQNEKYAEFLRQFEFESDIYQDTDDYSIINSGINVTK